MNENENVLDGFQISGIVCFVLALIFFLVGFFVGIDTGDIFIFCVVLSILLIIIGNILFSISGAKKQKLLDGVQAQIHSMQAAEEQANKSDDIDDFLLHYRHLLFAAQQLIAFEGRVPFTLRPSIQYNIFLVKKQWRTRDAIERHYSRVKKLARTTYRNNRAYIESLCRIFANEIEKNQSEFDRETLEFATKMRDQLFAECGILNAYNTASNPTNATDNASMSEIDGMEGHAFESYCANLLRKNGFENVIVTPGSGDQGVDVIAVKDSIRYAVQCKCYASALGNTPVQEVCAGKNMYNCHVGVVMTNNYFTASAKQLAEKNGILLWDRDKLQYMIDNTKREKCAL